MVVKIQNNELEVEIKSFGAELKSVKKNGKEFLWSGDPSVWPGQAPVLFPICGGLRDDKYIFEGREYSLQKHGFAKLREFEVESREDDRVTFLQKADEETLKQYPFEFELRITYSLCGSTIKIQYDVKNVDNKTMYFSIGAHEAYACPNGIEEYSVIFDKTETLNAKNLDGNLLGYETTHIMENSKVLPLKKKFFEIDALTFSDINSRKVTLKNERTGECIEVNFDGFDYFLLWTKPNGNYICIEPWCGLPDYCDSDYDITHKKGIIALAAGKTETKVHSITF